VTSWVLLLLVIYASLGLSRLSREKASRLALVITTIVVGFAMLRLGAV